MRLYASCSCFTSAFTLDTSWTDSDLRMPSAESSARCSFFSSSTMASCVGNQGGMLIVLCNKVKAALCSLASDVRIAPLVKCISIIERGSVCWCVA